MRNRKKIMIILGVLLLVFGGVFLYIVLSDKPKEEIKQEEIETEEEVVEEVEEVIEEKKLTIIDVDSNTRPVAVMINNINEARPYQSGLQDAYIVYEIQVESGITRLMALYKDQNTARIGSVRSARHYYLDYVMENDAVYVHFGWSYVAENQIPTLGINNINGLYDSGFFRDSSLPVAYEHTAFTTMTNIKNVITAKGYRATTTQEPLLNYTVDEVDLSSGTPTNNFKLTFSSYANTSFVYNSNNKVYVRYVNNTVTKDYVTKADITFKNIIVVKVNNSLYPGNNILLDYKNIGSGDGYYITNGYSIPIKWYKTSRSSQTVYKDLSGNEINVSDGNTYIGLVPINNSFTIQS